jgi:dihydrofolate reductase
MRKIVLYIASSLDGYIAENDGSVKWLDEIPNPEQSDYGYGRFYDSIDTVIIGNKTYQQVLGFVDGNPYAGKKTYVLTKNKNLINDDYAVFISKNISEILVELKSGKGKDIWCVGGGEINTLLLENKLIDEIKIFIMPVFLGSGIPLISRLDSKINLELTNQVSYQSGAVELDYQVKK